MAAFRRRLTPTELELLTMIAVSCDRRDRASSPFVPDHTVTVWKLVRKRMLEYVLPAGRGAPAFRPTSHGWARYDAWLEAVG